MANHNDLSLPFASRRSFLSLSAAASAALALRIVTEPMLAHARVHNFPKDAIRIDANGNPLGPEASARKAGGAKLPEGRGVGERRRRGESCTANDGRKAKSAEWRDRAAGHTGEQSRAGA